jgi:uncharacterized membrane protein (DUF4010 family)
VARFALTRDGADTGRAFELKSAIAFAALVTAVMFLTRLIESRFGAVGTVVAGAVAGLADAHASAASTASLHANGALADSSAVIAVLAALSTNTATKTVVAFASGTRAYGVRVAAGLVAMLAATWMAALL